MTAAPALVGGIAFPAEAAHRSRLVTENASEGVSLDLFSLRRCDGNSISDISFSHSVKLISKPLQVLVCLSHACVIRSPHCVNTRDFHAPLSQRLLIWSTPSCRLPDSLVAKVKSSTCTRQKGFNDPLLVTKSSQASFYDRFFTSQGSKIHDAG